MTCGYHKYQDVCNALASGTLRSEREVGDIKAHDNGWTLDIFWKFIMISGQLPTQIVLSHCTGPSKETKHLTENESQYSIEF